MLTEKVKSNEKRPENKLGCAFCISFQYKIKRKFTILGQIPNIFHLVQLPHSMKYIWYSFLGGGGGGGGDAEIFPLFIL